MGRSGATVERGFAGRPLEEIGGGLERLLAGGEGWTLGYVDREGGALDAVWRARPQGRGIPVRIELEPDGQMGSRLFARVGPCLWWWQAASARRAVWRLIAELERGLPPEPRPAAPSR